MEKLKDTFGRVVQSDVYYSFTHSPVTMLSALMTAVIIFAAIFAPWLTPHDPFNPSSLNIMDAFLPPAWESGGNWVFPLGTDDQGRDVLSTIMYGNRISLIVGFASIMLSVLIGVTLGIISGYAGGWLDSVIMRLADTQLTIPAILIALLVDGIARASLPMALHDELALYVIIFAIGVANWPQYARVTRSGTMVVKEKDYIAAARVIGVRPIKIMTRHILVNVLGPNLVVATIGLALAIITEATLSFLGVGVPPPRLLWEPLSG